MAAKKDAPANTAAAQQTDAQAPGPEATATAPAPKPRTPQAKALFVDEDGRVLSGTMAVLQVIDRYGSESGELAGLPRTLEFVGTWPTASHTAAASAARDAGSLAADADAVTLNARFVSAVDVPRPDAEAAR